MRFDPPKSLQWLRTLRLSDLPLRKSDVAALSADAMDVDVPGDLSGVGVEAKASKKSKKDKKSKSAGDVSVAGDVSMVGDDTATSMKKEKKEKKSKKDKKPKDA